MTQLRFLHSILLLILTTSVLTACSGSKEGGLITDAIALTNCPQNSCAQGLADAAETKILLQTPISNVLPVGSSYAEVAGDCYASLFPQNYFEVAVTLNGASIGNVFPAGFVPRCKQGKFYFPINLQNVGVGSYNLTAQLVVVDSQGIATRPPFKTISSTLVKR